MAGPNHTSVSTEKNFFLMDDKFNNFKTTGDYPTSNDNPIVFDFGTKPGGLELSRGFKLVLGNRSLIG